MSVEEGDIGVCIWFGAPVMHRMSGLSFAWHLHVVCVHVHLSSHFGTIESSGLLLKLHAWVCVKISVDLLACGIWAMRCIAMLWRDIRKPFMCGFSHVERRCGHVSLPLLGHKVQLGFWCVSVYTMYIVKMHGQIETSILSNLHEGGQKHNEV